MATRDPTENPDFPSAEALANLRFAIDDDDDVPSKPANAISASLANEIAAAAPAQPFYVSAGAGEAAAHGAVHCEVLPPPGERLHGPVRTTAKQLLEDAEKAVGNGNSFEERTALGNLPSDIGNVEHTVHVMYLPVTMTETEFKDMISPFGVYKRVRICGNPKKEQNWTYGFVEYETRAEAQKMIASRDGVRVSGYRLRCSIAKAPIVDRLSIDATPTMPCTFAERYPRRSLRDLIKASIQTDEGSGPEKVSAAGRNRTAAAAHEPLNPTGMIPTMRLPPGYQQRALAAVGDAVRFMYEDVQSYFFNAKQHLMAAVAMGTAHNESCDPSFVIASFLAGADPALSARLLLTQLCLVHGSIRDALQYATDALQSVPSLVTVTNYKLGLDNDPTSEKAAWPTGWSAQLLNTILVFGMLLEPVSAVAARAFYVLAHRRAALEKYPNVVALDDVVQSPLCTFAESIGMVAPPAKATSLVKSFFPALHTGAGDVAALPAVLFEDMLQRQSIYPAVTVFTQPAPSNSGASTGAPQGSSPVAGAVAAPSAIPPPVAW